MIVLVLLQLSMTNHPTCSAEYGLLSVWFLPQETHSHSIYQNYSSCRFVVPDLSSLRMIVPAIVSTIISVESPYTMVMLFEEKDSFDFLIGDDSWIPVNYIIVLINWKEEQGNLGIEN